MELNVFQRILNALPVWKSWTWATVQTYRTTLSTLASANCTFDRGDGNVGTMQFWIQIEDILRFLTSTRSVFFSFLLLLFLIQFCSSFLLVNWWSMVVDSKRIEIDFMALICSECGYSCCNKYREMWLFSFNSVKNLSIQQRKSHSNTWLVRNETLIGFIAIKDISIRYNELIV